jgi:hypothetical protein
VRDGPRGISGLVHLTVSGASAALRSAWAGAEPPEHHPGFQVLAICRGFVAQLCLQYGLRRIDRASNHGLAPWHFTLRPSG